MLKVGMVAGETSGDMLGAGLIESLSHKYPEIRSEGIGGPNLANQGMKIIYPMDDLSVMGITEVLGRYNKLKKIRNNIRNHFINNPPDVFIGIDAPDFNLWLEKELHNAGIKTVHYVSPSVWAWREYRINKIAQAVDLILNLFPFETSLYEKHNIPNRFVGHPLADKLVGNVDIKSARKELGLPEDKTIVALLPGSRINEINKIAGPILQAADLANSSRGDLYFISGLVNQKTLIRYKAIKENIAPELKVDMFVSKTHRVIEASDIVVLASGTATLEVMLMGKPMVVTYRLSWLTYFIVKLLAKIPYAALPNILAGKELVTECLQKDCNSRSLAKELINLLESQDKVTDLKEKFSNLSNQLKKNANEQAATAVLELLGKNGRG